MSKSIKGLVMYWSLLYDGVTCDHLLHEPIKKIHLMTWLKNALHRHKKLKQYTTGGLNNRKIWYYRRHKLVSTLNNFTDFFFFFLWNETLWCNRKSRCVSTINVLFESVVVIIFHPLLQNINSFKCFQKISCFTP